MLEYHELSAQELMSIMVIVSWSVYSTFIGSDRTRVFFLHEFKAVTYQQQLNYNVAIISATLLHLPFV